MCSPLYLKHAFNLSDEQLCEWSENVVWQYFSGLEYYEPRMPCDAAQIGHCNELIKGAGTAVKQAFVDLGYRRVDAQNPGIEVVHRGRIGSMSKLKKRQLLRRQAIEPAIGHVKHDNRMIRCYLQGSTGDALHAISCAAGYNIRWLMRAILRLGLKGLFALALLAVYWPRIVQRRPLARIHTKIIADPAPRLVSVAA